MPPTSRFDVFLSHSSADKPLVKIIADKLRAEGLAPWLDVWELVPGADWEPGLAHGLQSSRHCAFFVGPRSSGSWAEQERQLAQDRAARDPSYRLIPILLPGVVEPFDFGSLPPFLLLRTWVDFRRGIDDPTALQRLVAGIKGISPGHAAGVPRDESAIEPYRGLQVFDEVHADCFFGRDAEVQRIVERFKDNRFLAVLGASGSGKSSVVRAGLLPALRGGALRGSVHWPIRVVRPRSTPLTELAAELARSSGQGTVAGHLAALRGDAGTLYQESLAALHDESQQMIWVVDQFEEVYTLCQDDKERTRFIDNLLFPASVRDGRVCILLTMRADFYFKCASHPELAARISASQFLLGPIDESGLREVVERPAALAGYSFEPGLVETILDDVRQQPGALPLLEYALFQLWQQRDRDRRALTLAAYQAIGGVAGALAQRAEEVHESLSEVQRPIARRVMLRLTQPGQGAEDTRRSAAMEEFFATEAEAPQVEDTVLQLVNARLLTVTSRAGNGRLVDVAHEALIRGWPRLRKWIDEDREGQRLHRRITADAGEWIESRHETGFLYRGARLAQSMAWLESHLDTANAIERDFIAAGQAAREREAASLLQAERERYAVQQRELEQAQALASARQQQVEAAERVTGRTRAFSVGLAVFALLALLLTVAVFKQRERADSMARTSLARQLAAQSIDTSSRNLDLALLLALQAVTIERSSETLSSLGHGVGARGAVQRILTGPSAWVNAVAASDDGRWFASADDHKVVIVWEAASGKVRWRLGQAAAATALAFAPDSAWLASADSAGEVIQWDMATGQRLRSWATGDPVRTLVASADGASLASGGKDGRLRRWRLTDAQVRATAVAAGPDRAISGLALAADGRWLSSAGEDGRIAITSSADADAVSWIDTESKSVTALAASAKGSLFAVANGEGVVAVWDSASGHPQWSKQKHQGAVYSLAFSRDGQWLASGGEDGAVQLSRVNDGSQVALLSGHREAVKSVAFGAGDRQLVSGGPDLRLIVWELDAVRLPGVFVGAGALDHVALSGDGKLLAAAGKSGDTYLWKLPATAPPVVFKDHDKAVQGLAFDRDSHWLATASVDETVVLRALGAAASSPGATRVLHRHTRDVWGVAFSPDGGRLASGSTDGTVIVWSTSTPAEPLTLPARKEWVYGVAFSPDGRFVASSGGDHDVRISDAHTGQPLETLAGHLRSTNGIAFSRNGAWLAVTSDDHEVSLWRTADWTRTALLKGHAAEVWGVAFSPDDRTLVSGARDGTLIAWDVAGKKPLFQLHNPEDPVYSVEWLPDGLQVVTAGGAMRARLWDMDVAGWPARACAIANRNLTHAEWRQYVGGQLDYKRTCEALPDPTDP